MVAQQTELEVGEFIWSGGIVIFMIIIESRLIFSCRANAFTDPEVKQSAILFDYRFEDIVLEGYKAHPKLTGVVAI